MRLVLYVLLFCFLAGYASASDGQSREDLSRIEQHLKSYEEKQQKLEQERQRVQSEINQLRKNMIKAASEVRKHEQSLLNLESDVNKLNDEIETKRSDLGLTQNDMAKLILALQRISRVPPEVLVVRPSAPLDTARSAQILQASLPVIEGRAIAIKDQLAEIQALYSERHGKYEEAKEVQKSLETRQANLTSLVDRKQTLAKELDKDFADQAARINELAQKATSLRDLLKRLSQFERKAGNLASRSKPLAASIKTDEQLQAMWPVAGQIVLAYGDQDQFGIDNQGLRVRVRPGATVISPLDGIIKYAGPFRNYDQLLILEHTEGYHVIIAGLQNVYVDVGTDVLRGEPLGTVSQHQTRAHEVYLEIRKSGQPTDPEPILAANERD